MSKLFVELKHVYKLSPRAEIEEISNLIFEGHRTFSTLIIKVASELTESSGNKMYSFSQ